MTAEQLATIAKETEERTPLPEGWRLMRLGDICQFVYGSGLSTTQREKGNVPVYGSNGLVGWHSQAITSGQTVIIGRKGSVGEINYSLIACFPIDTTYYIDETCTSIDLRFLFYLLKNANLKELNKSTAIPGLNRDDAYALKVTLPQTIEEQRRVAAILDEQMDAVEQARRAVEEQLEAANLLPNALFFESFDGIIPLTIDPLEENAPEGWRWETLRNLARLESGHTPSRYHPEWWGGDIPWLALPDIRNLDGKTAVETSEYTNKLGIANSSARILPTGTVCLSRTASVGFVTVMGRPMATSQDFVNWVCGEQLDPYFLSFILQASRDYLLSLATGAVHKTIYVPTVKEFRICLPGLPEQKRIAERLSEQMQAVENLKDSLSAQLKTIDKMPAGLLRKAFAGEV